MRVLFIGSSGQLGQELLTLINGDIDLDILKPSSNEFNILNTKLMINYINSNKPDLVVNLSAYTNVDLAEQKSDLAMKINFEGIKSLGDICSSSLIPLIHISTDYVFGDKSKAPHKINDIHDPKNLYGKSKSLGEKYLSENCQRVIIIRTASLYGLYRKNFFKTFIDILSNKKKINVVDDQKISLTWTYDLALSIYQIINLFKKNYSSKNMDNSTTLHLVNSGFTNWYDVVHRIANFMSKINKDYSKLVVNPVSSEEWNAIAIRPKDSRLEFYGMIFGEELVIPEWNVSLNNALDLYFSGEDIGKKI